MQGAEGTAGRFCSAPQGPLRGRAGGGSLACSLRLLSDVTPPQAMNLQPLQPQSTAGSITGLWLLRRARTSLLPPTHTHTSAHVF